MWTRSLLFLKRELIARRLPHGLFGPAYLWPGDDQRVRLHRQLWWRSKPHRLPRLIWLAIELWLWLRWLTWYALPACRRASRQCAPTIASEEGIPVSVLTRRILKLALRWCIPPAAAYHFRLYRHPEQALDYVFDTESAAYHAWRNALLGITPASLNLIQDKARFAEALGRHGRPIVATLATVARYDAAFDLNAFVHAHGSVFCKMNSGNQGRGAFAVWPTPAGLAGRSFTGQTLPDKAAVAVAWQALIQLDTVLIQPALANHPELAPLSYNDDVITVRFISQWECPGRATPSASLSCLCATLEVPAGMGRSGATFYAILPIDAETGQLGEAIAPLTDDVEVIAAQARVKTAALGIDALPGWPALREASQQAHRLFPDIRAIAWDWVLTPAGPYLLEGNTGWGLAVPQRLLGGGALGAQVQAWPGPDRLDCTRE